MSEALNQFQLVTTGAAGKLDLWLPWAGPVLLGVLALWVGLPVWRRRRREAGERRVIERLAAAHVRDAVLPNGIDGMTQVDYLLLTPSGIVVADVKRYQGYLFGGEHIELWTQVIDNRSYKFPNPLFKNDMDVMAVRERVPGTPVSGRLIFLGEGSFPKGRPERVSMLDTLAEDLGLASATDIKSAGTRDAVAAGSERYQAAWTALLGALSASAGPRRVFEWRLWLAGVLLLAALLTSGWLLQAAGIFPAAESSRPGTGAATQDYS